MSGWLAARAAAVYGAAWEARRRAYAAGWRRPERVPARVVSIGNLTAGGAGKTTLTLHLAARAAERGEAFAIVCRRYRPGPGGDGDEERLYRAAFAADRVHAGDSKLALARRAASAGAALVLVDDGFSHWRLARDVDVVLIDASDPWGGGRLLPAGRLREPRRALQRASAVVVSRLEPSQDPAPLLAEAARFAPSALLAAGRHEVVGVRGLDGAPWSRRGPAHVVTGTGNPGAVERSAREAGFGPVTRSAYRDHHWFSPVEAARERSRAAGATLLLTAKDAVRWPAAAGGDAGVAVLEVRWRWIAGGDAVERLVLDGEG